MGRFLSQDAYPYNLSNPVELNRYGYTANNPINYTDPKGAVENLQMIFPVLAHAMQLLRDEPDAEKGH